MMSPVALEMGAWTTACTTPESRNPWAWTNFLLLAPCPQHVLISSLHLIFMALLAIYAVTCLIAVRRARASAAHQNGFSKLSGVRISLIYSAQVAFIVLVMVFQWCVALWRVVYWRRVPAQELVYSLSQALAWTVFAAVVGHQKKLRATVHSKPLRVWWIMTFVFSLLTQYTSIARYVRNDPRDVHLWVDGVLSMATFPVIVLLALVAVVGRTGISVDDGGLTESLLGSDGGQVSDDAVGVTEFASASFISKLMWLWLNPLLKRGRFKALELEDVPLLAPEDRSEMLYSRDEYLLEPKHSIFLSHSGAQKSFVDQLCLDIERHDRYPFFDKRRNCLSIGCNFPDLIFEAINQCQVAVLVLSEEFFSRSKWPLLELAALVKRKSWDPKLIIMPVFLGLTHAQCRDKLNHDRWMRVWQGWAEVDSRIDLKEWQASLKVFGYTNGISVNEMMDEVKCRGEIVQADCKEVPPRTRWDDTHVQGRSRLSMAIRVKIDGMQVAKNYGARILGVYGVGGIGKTTACKVLCNDYFEEFEGKVCHVEFGVGNKFSMLQEILKRLTETNQEVMKNFSEDECKDRIKNGLKKKVFLAIDNVSPTQQSFDEARQLLRMEFMQGSIVIVTARSLSQLQNVNVGECMEMPELDVGEARALFLYHAVPGTYWEIAHEMSEHLLKQCVDRCYFRKGNCDNSCHYHPLALKVLGGQLGSEPNEWIDKLNELDPFNLWDEKEKDHPIFSILGRSFDLLNVDDQVLFMDVAIFFPKLRYYMSSNVLKWLSMVHGKSLYIIKGKLERLKSKSLLENVGDGSEEIGMHDLWREFAIMKSKGGEFDSRPWIYEKIYGPNDSRREEPKLLGSGGWENLQRICLVGDTERGCTVKEIDLGWYSNLRVLKLVDVYINTKMLDVSALMQLKSLQISYAPEYQALEILGLGCLRSLVFLDLRGMQVTKASLPEEIGGLTSLQALSIRIYGIPLPIVLDFSRLNLLRDVNMERFYDVDKITGLSSRMTNLKCLQLSWCSSLRSCHGVGDLVALEELDLSMCRWLKELPDLGRLKHLLKLNISDCSLIEVVSGLGDLVSLQRFGASCCRKLAELPKMCKLFNLQRLRVDGCPSLGAIPGLSDVVGLEELWADCRGLEGCHDLRKLRKLESVWVNGWDAEGLPCLADLVNLKSLRIVSAVEITGLLDLTRIERLNLWSCRFERLPDLHKLPRLEELGIENFSSWAEWKIGSGLRLSGADLHIAGTFPHLKTLQLMGVALTELPDLSSFPQLSELEITVCQELTSLTSSAPLTALKRLDLYWCKRLRALPDVSHLVSLSTLSLHNCGELKLTAYEMEKLQTMCPGLKLDISFTELR